ncbi:polyketide biosynthesis protein [Paenibacillus glucanolyticus]|uniref:Polyketide biosynthesis protein n=2 Tax=Paenibacillus glucanolyticus TaxID=59843 RepID=A0A163DTV7_9BACL|nr:MBL fold metallo-hydrolase [Paenibacillus glucanolyticus]KZS43428.1 polyketide biosynthesis protein [Paenibacillus glucanolyticus]
MVNYEVFALRTVSLPYINYCYIVLDKSSRSALLIDPSWELDAILGKLNDLNADVKGIMLTHSHYDHVNLTLVLTEIFECDVFMSNVEIEDYGFHCRNLISVSDQEVISIGRTKVTCLWTPGHTSGSMCFLLEDCVFTGDTLFIEGCGGCHYPGGSAEAMFESIQKIKALAAPNLRVYPGHSYGAEPGQTIRRLYDQNIYFQLDSRKHFVDFRMRPNQKSVFNFR